MRKLNAKETKAALEALAKIAMMGDGVKDNMKDWAQMGRNAKSIAVEAFRPKCKTCGK